MDCWWCLRNTALKTSYVPRLRTVCVSTVERNVVRQTGEGKLHTDTVRRRNQNIKPRGTKQQTYTMYHRAQMYSFRFHLSIVFVIQIVLPQGDVLFKEQVDKQIKTTV